MAKLPKTLEELAAGKWLPGDADDQVEWGQLTPPPWFDQAKFERGIAFFRAHMSSVLFSYLLSLVAGFNLEVFLQTLLFTGQSSSPEVSGKRYFATLLYILQWYDPDITDPDSKGHKSLMRVRRIHHHVRLALKKRQKQLLLNVVDHRKRATDQGYLEEAPPRPEETIKDTTKEEDSEDDFVYIDVQGLGTRSDDHDVFPSVHEAPTTAMIPGDDLSFEDLPSTLSSTPSGAVSIGNSLHEEEQQLYLNQYDMALVQIAFVAGIVLYPDWIGINAYDEELEDYIFTWRVFGWYLGIEDRFNVCEGRFADVRSIAGEIRDYELIPAIKKLSPDADMIARAFIKGSHEKFQGKNASISSFLSPAALISISRRPFNLPEQYEPPDLKFGDQVASFLLHVFFFITYYVPPFRRLVNSCLSLPNVMRLIA